MFRFVENRQFSPGNIRTRAACSSILRVVLGVAFVAGGAAAQSRAVLDANTVLLVGRDEPAPIVQAAGDLASDMAKVFGKRPRILQNPQAGAPLTILIGRQSAMVRQLGPATSA